MADPEHVKIALQGKEAIEKWRSKRSETSMIFDLKNTNLQKANLGEGRFFSLLT